MSRAGAGCAGALCVALLAGLAVLPEARADGPAVPPPAEARMKVTTMTDAEALRVGRGVESIRQAIADPASPGALDAVRELGLDSRYYAMVRGWLVQELRGAQHIREARGGAAPPAIQARIEFLERAIRDIDLE